MAVLPFGHVTRRFDDSYLGLFHGGQTAKMPLSPSTTMSLASAAVLDTIAPRLPGIDSALLLAHSVTLLVFPNPRPASNSQYAHLPGGANCFGLAQNGQRYSRTRRSCCVGAISASSRCRSNSGCKAIQLAHDSLLCIASIS